MTKFKIKSFVYNTGIFGVYRLLCMEVLKRRNPGPSIMTDKSQTYLNALSISDGRSQKDYIRACPNPGTCCPVDFAAFVFNYFTL